jgi:hypothetical protein
VFSLEFLYQPVIDSTLAVWYATKGRIAFWGTLSLILLAGIIIFTGDGPSVR